MKVATWNVNGIRARQAQVREWAERERPDVICLQEIKAAPSQLPVEVCELPGYWCYWPGERAYSGVALLMRNEFSPGKPSFTHPPFDFENRIVTAKAGPVTFAS